tara:strand:+ start:269 stop:712 length:444 start_codon:yes stop_codon:yes gene_type:complete
MSKVFKICITKESGQDLEDMDSINVIANKGIINDRYFSDDNDNDIQLTLIEKENIDYYNSISNSDIPYINFRRNIITSGIQLNDLVGKELFIGNVKIKAHRLCDPCKYLQDKLNDNNLVKKLLNKGGLRCQIISDGLISVEDEINII